LECWIGGAHHWQQRAAGLPQLVKIPLIISIPFSTLPLTLTMPVVSEQFLHQALFSYLLG